VPFHETILLSDICGGGDGRLVRAGQGSRSVVFAWELRGCGKGPRELPVRSVAVIRTLYVKVRRCMELLCRGRTNVHTNSFTVKVYYIERKSINIVNILSCGNMTLSNSLQQK
jgi:hypothetical protein